MPEAKFPHLELLIIQALKKHVKNYESGFSEKFTITIEPVVGQNVAPNGAINSPPRVPGSIELVQFNATLQLDHQESQSIRFAIQRSVLDEIQAWKWQKQVYPNPHNLDDWE